MRYAVPIGFQTNERCHMKSKKTLVLCLLTILLAFVPSEGRATGCGCPGSQIGGSALCMSRNAANLAAGAVGSVVGGSTQYQAYIGDFFLMGSGAAIAGAGLYTANPFMIWWGGSITLSGAIPFVTKVAASSITSNLQILIDPLILMGSYIVMKGSTPESRTQEISKATLFSAILNIAGRSVHHIVSLLASDFFQKEHAEMTPETCPNPHKGGMGSDFNDWKKDVDLQLTSGGCRAHSMGNPWENTCPLKEKLK